MATKRKILLPTITGISASSAAGTVGTINLPLEYRYHNIELVYIDGGASPADVTAVFGDIAVYRNSKIQRIHTAAELDHLNGLNNEPGATTYNRQQINTGANMRQTLPIFFAEPWRKDKADADAMAWSVAAQLGWNSFQIQITLLANMPSTGSIIAYAYVDAPLIPANNQPQAVKKVYRQQLPASGTSIDVTTLDLRDAYQVLAFKHPTTGYITDVSLKYDGVFIMERVIREDNIGHLTALGLNPANSTTASAFGYDVVLDADDPINSALPALGHSLWLTLEFSAAAAGNVVALIERLGAFD